MQHSYFSFFQWLVVQVGFIALQFYISGSQLGAVFLPRGHSAFGLSQLGRVCKSDIQKIKARYTATRNTSYYNAKERLPQQRIIWPYISISEVEKPCSIAYQFRGNIIVNLCSIHDFLKRQNLTYKNGGKQLKVSSGKSLYYEKLNDQDNRIVT